MRVTAILRMVGGSLIGLMLTASAQASFWATGVTGTVRLADENEMLSTGQSIDGGEIVLESGGRLMAFYDGGAVQGTLIAVGPGQLQINGNRITLQSGQIRLIVSGQPASGEPAFELVLATEFIDKEWMVQAGEVRATREGEDGMAISYQGPGSLSNSDGDLLQNGQGMWSDSDQDPQMINASELSGRLQGLSDLKDLRLSHARSRRAEREQNLFDTVLEWDKVSKSEAVQPELHRQNATRARAEIRQVASVTTSVTPPRATTPPVVSTGQGITSGAGALSITGNRIEITRGAGVLNLAGN
jgi:hypothetical protein